MGQEYLVVIFLTTLLLSFCSLLPVALQTRTTRKLINPAFVVGDFLILPFVTTVILTSSQTVLFPLHIIIILCSFVITIMAGIRFRLLSIWWLPHGLFFFFFLYILLAFFSNSFWLIIQGKSSWQLLTRMVVVSVCVTIHQILGIIWPKKLT